MATQTQPKYYRVEPDGKAPKGLSAGDQVVTASGTYRIDAVNADGSYASTLVDKNLTTQSFQGQYAAVGKAETPADSMRQLLDAWGNAALAQKEAKADFETAQGIAKLNEAQAAAEEAFQAQRDQNEIDSARAMDNAALYAEARGDRGGIGLGQYNELQAAKLKNRQTIRTAQTKLAADTAREIQALRAKGEYEKADALLDVTQKNLSQLITLEKWSASWENTQAQLQRSLEQWEKSYELSRAGVTGELANGTATRAAQKEQQSQLAASGEALLKVGVMPSEAQLAAMGMTAGQAQAYINSLIRQGKVY